MDAPNARLGLWDTISIIVGIVVGVSIFKAPPLIFANVASPGQALVAWTAGGLLALVGALCYAELATTYPQSGGDFVYLSRAFGRGMGFLFGWAQIVAVLTGSVCVMAYVFADYAAKLFELPPAATIGFAIGAVMGLTFLNALGLVAGKAAQNMLTLAKVLGVAGVLLTGLFWGAAPDPLEVRNAMDGPGFGLAMVLVLYTYGGWNDAAFITAEIRDPQRHVPRALFVGISFILLLYLLMNLAYLKALGFEGLRVSTTPASDVLELSFGAWASKALSLLVMTSALGAVNGMLLTGSRLYSTVGKEHRLLAVLGRWNRQLGAPVWSLLAQATGAILLILTVGTPTGRNVIDACFRIVAVTPPAWEDFSGDFERLIAGTAPIYWFFFFLTGVSLFVLRIRDPEAPRPFSVPVYPLPPLVFCGMCAYMLWSSLAYAGMITLVWIVPVLVGIPVYWVSSSRQNRGEMTNDELPNDE